MGGAHRNVAVILAEMVNELTFLELHVKGVPLERFQEDPALQRAAYRALEVLGEASVQVPATFREAHPDLPWQEMRAMRNFLIHAYHRVDPARVWRTVHQDALPLKPMLEDLLARSRG